MKLLMTKAADLIFSFCGLVLLAPLFLFISILILIESKGGIFYCQWRVGLKGKNFKLIKFRTMEINSEKSGFLTIGNNDPRITKVGYYLRKYKLDELPQLINVLKCEMSIVGPRPEVRKYVDLYDNDQVQILKIRPGITDFASISFKNENEILKNVDDADLFYIKHIMPEKILLSKIYLNNPSIRNYFKIIFITIRSIFTQ